MEQTLRIGQVSNLYGISLDTLRYYDRKGLLKPMIDKQSGYRYYSLEQLDTLEMILVGKHLEIPLERIKEKIDSESIRGYLDMIQEQLQFIEAKKKALSKLFQYTTKMKNMLTNIENHTNDNTFSTVTIEKTLEVTIYQLNLNDFLNSRINTVINGIEAFEQWVFYYVNEEGVILENTQTIGLSIHSDVVHAKELHEYLENGAEQDSIAKYCLFGGYRHISFWGNETDLKEYLQLLCMHFKLSNTTLTIKFRFALLHKEVNHEYWADIYFSE